MTCNKLQLISPNVQYEQEYYEMLDEWKLSGQQLVPFVLEFTAISFKEIIQKLYECSQGIGIPDGFVPHSTFWMINEENKILGVSNLRHRLTEGLRIKGGHIGYGIRPSERGKKYSTKILELTLREAKNIGINKVLVTCDKENIASARSVFNNNGILEKEHVVDGVLSQNYRIII